MRVENYYNFKPALTTVYFFEIASRISDFKTMSIYFNNLRIDTKNLYLVF